MIDYRVDLTKPYLVVDMDDTHVVVTGTSRVLETSDGEFGGSEGTWRVPKTRLLNKEQKRRLKYIHRVYGYEAAANYYKDTCVQVIAEHSNSLSG